MTWQRLAVRARVLRRPGRHVTRLATFPSSDIAIASIDRSGQVDFNRQDEAAILCRFMGSMESVPMMHIAEAAEG